LSGYSVDLNKSFQFVKLQLTHIVQIGRAACPPGQAYWQFIGVSINDGIAAYRVQVRDLSGNGAPNILVLRNYTTAPKFPAPITPAYFPNGEAGFTEGGGDKFGAREFGYGGSSVTGTAGGPDSFWVSASPNGQQPQYSDLALGFGWLGGTNHLNPSPIFQYTIKSDVPVPPPTTTGRFVLANIGPDGKIVAYIPFITGSPSTPGQGVLALMDNGQIVSYVNWVTEG